MSSRADRARRRFDVLGVGAALIDHLSHGDGELVARLGLAPHVMTLVGDEEARRLSGVLTSGRAVSGGTVANTLVGVASLGGAACFVGAVANDALGRRYEEDLAASGVVAHLSARDGGESRAGTGCCYVVVDASGERTMATYLGVSGSLGPEALRAEVVADSALTYFDGYLLDFPEAPAILEALFELASRAGTRVCLGLADPLVVERHHGQLAELSGVVDLLFSNELEATALTDTSDAHDALEALCRPNLTLAVTRGSKGALVARGDELVEVEAVPVADVVDVTGAGDQFAAGMCFGMAIGLSLEACARLGALAASEVIGHLGARPEISLAGLAVDAGLI